MYQGRLLLALDALPGGGMGHGRSIQVEDQEQCFSCNIMIRHRVRGEGAARKVRVKRGA